MDFDSFDDEDLSTLIDVLDFTWDRIDKFIDEQTVGDSTAISRMRNAAVRAAKSRGM